MRWKADIIDQLKKQETANVFTTKSFLSQVSKKHQKSERTVKGFLNELLNSGTIENIVHGLYRVSENTQGYRPQNILNMIVPNAVVSLDSVFTESDGKSIRGKVSSSSGLLYTISPIPYSLSPPKTGVMQTNIGNVYLLSIKESLFDVGGDCSYDKSKEWKQHTPEAATAYALLMDGNARYSYSISSDYETIRFPTLKIKEFASIAQKLQVDPKQIAKHSFRFKKPQREELKQLAKELLEARGGERQSLTNRLKMPLTKY